MNSLHSVGSLSRRIQRVKKPEEAAGNARARQHWRTDLLAIILYTVLTIAMLWPAAQRLNTDFLGYDIDVWINPWSDWWTAKALHEGRNLFFTDWMFYPQGVDLYFHSFSHFNTAVALALQPIWGALGAANTAILLAHILSGLGMFYLARYVSGSGLAAFFAGLVFAFFPYRLEESSHPVIVSTQWLPFYLLYLMRCVREGRLRFALLGAIFLTLTALTSWHLFLFAIFLSLIYLSYVLVAERNRLNRRIFNRLLFMGVLTLVGLAPLLAPTVNALINAPASYYQAELSDGKGNDLIGFILPARFNPIWSQLVAPIYDRLQRRTIYLGFIVLALVCFAAWRDWRRARFWVILAGVVALLSLGSSLQFDGVYLAGPLPWADPVTRLLRHPFRFNVLLGLALAVASGLGLARLLERPAGQRAGRQWAITSVASIILLFEYLAVPFPTMPATVPNFFTQLASQPGPGAILSLPMGRQPSKPYLYYQTIHGRPIVEGVVSRTPADAYAWIESVPALRSLRTCDRNFPPADLTNLFPQLEQLGIEYVTLHPAWVSAASLERWRGSQSALPDYEDKQMMAYATGMPPRIGTPGTRQLLGGCLGVRSLQTEVQTHVPGQVVPAPVEWTVGNKPPACCWLRLTVSDTTGQIMEHMDYPLVFTGLALAAPGTRRQMTYPLPLDPKLLPGRYQVGMQIVDSDSDRADELTAHLFDLQIAATLH